MNVDQNIYRMPINFVEVCV